MHAAPPSLSPPPHPFRVPGRCRLCANHNRYVEIKGHKWYCPFKSPDHSCSMCEITRKRQLANQLRVTQDLHGDDLGGQVGVEGSRQAAVPSMCSSKQREYPRLKELEDETSNILDPELFRQINERVWHKVTHH